MGSLPVFFWHVWPVSLQEVPAGVGGCDKATSGGKGGYREKICVIHGRRKQPTMKSDKMFCLQLGMSL